MLKGLVTAALLMMGTAAHADMLVPNGGHVLRVNGVTMSGMWSVRLLHPTKGTSVEVGTLNDFGAEGKQNFSFEVAAAIKQLGIRGKARIAFEPITGLDLPANPGPNDLHFDLVKITAK